MSRKKKQTLNVSVSRRTVSHGWRGWGLSKFQMSRHGWQPSFLTNNLKIMLKHLSIINLAVIENVELSFREGMTVLTGETGAGKSILIGALGLVLGDRADTSVIRTGCARTEISAAFSVAEDERLLSLLEEQSINVADNELVLRRVVNRDGRSRAYINTTTVPLQLLRDAGAFLIDIHGQHAHQGLLKRDVQRELLDGFGDHGAISDQVSRAFEKWEGVTREISSLTDTEGESGDRLSLLKYQVEELQALELEENEVDRLEDEYKRLANINNLLETVQSALDGLHAGEQSVADRINTVKKELTALERFDPGWQTLPGYWKMRRYISAKRPLSWGLTCTAWTGTQLTCTRWNSVWSSCTTWPENTGCNRNCCSLIIIP